MVSSLRLGLLVLAVAAFGCSSGGGTGGGAGGGSAGGAGGGSAGGAGGGTAGGSGGGSAGGSAGGSGGGTAQCSASTCPTGCCTSTGTCDTGDTSAACGKAGAACVQCTGTLQCSNGSCLDPLACNASTCATGCCQTDGGCNTQLSFRRCGTGGAACVECPGAQNCIAPGACAAVNKFFLSSQRTPGNFGGLAEADALCVDSAADAGLGGDWVALLGNSTTSGSARLPDAGPWYLWRTSNKLFESKADIQAAMEPSFLPAADEYGFIVNTSVQEQDVYVWTGDSNDSCIGWTNQLGGNNGRCGNARSAVDWRSATLCGCNEQRRLYCFEK